MSAPESIGSLAEKWWERKKLFEWTYKTPLGTLGPMLEKHGPLVCAVSLMKTHGEQVVFVAESRWFGGRIGRDRLEDKTLEGLRKKVERAFYDKIVAHTDVQWTDWIEIEIAGREVEIPDEEFTTSSRRHHRDGRRGSASIMLEWKVLKRAKFPDGRDMVLDGNSLYPFPTAKAAGVDPDKKEPGRYWNNSSYSQDSNNQFAYIPATPENLEAMNSLMLKIGELNGRLLALLDQKSVGKTLVQLAGGSLLLEKR